MKMFINENSVTSIENEEIYALISPRNEIILLNDSIEYMKFYTTITHSTKKNGYRISKGSTKNFRYTHKEWVNI